MFSRGQAVVASQTKDQVFDAIVQSCKEVMAKIENVDRTRYIITGKSPIMFDRLGIKFHVVLKNDQLGTLIELYDTAPVLIHPDKRFLEPLLKSIATRVALESGYRFDKVNQINLYKISSAVNDNQLLSIEPHLLEHCEYDIEIVDCANVPEIKDAHKLIINPSEQEYTLEFKKKKDSDSLLTLLLRDIKVANAIARHKGLLKKKMIC